MNRRPNGITAYHWESDTCRANRRRYPRAESQTFPDRLVKIGAKIVRQGRSIGFQMAEVMDSRGLFQEILDAIAALRPLPAVRC